MEPRAPPRLSVSSPRRESGATVPSHSPSTLLSCASSETATEKRRRWTGVLSVFGGVLVHVCLGTVYTWGTLAVYVVSYMRLLQIQSLQAASDASTLLERTSEEDGSSLSVFAFASAPSLVRLSDSAWVLASQFAGMTLGMPLGGIAQKTLGPCRTVILGGALMSLAVGMAPVLLHSYALFVTVFGVIQGVGLGLAYTAPLLCGLAWFPEKKGVVSGAITAGFGTGALLFSPLQAAFLNPLSIAPSQAPYASHPAELYYDISDSDQLEILLRVPRLFRLLAVCYLLLVSAGAALLRVPAASPGVRTPGASACVFDEEAALVKSLEREEVRDETREEARATVSVRTALGSWTFWSLWTLFFLNGLAICFTASFWRLLAVDRNTRAYILTETQLALVGAAASACNAVGRLAWGHLADKRGFQTSLMGLSALWSLLLFFLPNAAPKGGLCYALAVSGSFFCLGGNFSVFPSAVASVFGPDAIGHLYGFIFGSQLASSLGFAYLTQRVAQTIGTDGLSTLMGLCTALTAMSVFCLPALSPTPRKRHSFQKQS
ncbi:transporter, major facilitator family protein [Toxoplasma gondii TgCatPRC2]|uniref:Transporter, major facilitator family protein n=1 Tax=Toxoplasma gondii TgCatPRC2 TaxID=1130821 RepID=A0A151HQ58_TOXGO|nr:transporter, major facilitator family protein [Toxoplasma gondii TgCatPRC2]